MQIAYHCLITDMDVHPLKSDSAEDSQLHHLPGHDGRKNPKHKDPYKHYQDRTNMQPRTPDDEEVKGMTGSFVLKGTTLQRG